MMTLSSDLLRPPYSQVMQLGSMRGFLARSRIELIDSQSGKMSSPAAHRAHQMLATAYFSSKQSVLPLGIAPVRCVCSMMVCGGPLIFVNDRHVVIGLQAAARHPLPQRRCAAVITFYCCSRSYTEDISTADTVLHSLVTMSGGTLMSGASPMSRTSASTLRCIPLIP
jgi:hypothetical protein